MSIKIIMYQADAGYGRILNEPQIKSGQSVCLLM